ncbi:uncharacterized protein LOC141910298 [Tubulanus polymorphus]|uniref:uncharacterized protein LOC141910298 n=1 Tax=Tubulanus polymorphus TaxID=672921 RepID=UPI003DA68235
MQPLPNERVCRSLPFTYTGLDYFGPPYIREANEVMKVWVCLFTCLTVREIHLEMVRDMSTSQFLLCLRRFVAQRGKPKNIISDNASQFKLADATLAFVWKKLMTNPDIKGYAANEGILRRYITELAPWKGGVYERMVGVVKKSLRKAIGNLSLSGDQLITILKEVEAVVNSRPIVYVGEDINSGVALTPGDFLSIKTNTGIPADNVHIDDEIDDPDYERPGMSSGEKMTSLWKKGQIHLNKFWVVWYKDYLLSLRERKKFTLKAPHSQSPFVPEVGDIVLIKDNLPRGSWKFGKIEENFSSSDGECRSVVVKLPSGNTTRRAINTLYPLECPGKVESSESSISDGEIEPPTENIILKRPVRKATVKARELLQDFISDNRL